MSLLNEAENNWGKPRDKWSKAEWQEAAELLNSSLSMLHELLTVVGAELRRVKESEAAYKAAAVDLLDIANKQQPRRIGRNPLPVSVRIGRLLKKKKIGRPAKKSKKDKEIILEKIEHIKIEKSLKTDVSAVKELLKKTDPRTRITEQKNLIKNLSRWRKEIA